MRIQITGELSNQPEGISWMQWDRHRGGRVLVITMHNGSTYRVAGERAHKVEEAILNTVGNQ